VLWSQTTPKTKPKTKNLQQFESIQTVNNQPEGKIKGKKKNALPKRRKNHTTTLQTNKKQNNET